MARVGGEAASMASSGRRSCIHGERRSLMSAGGGAASMASADLGKHGRPARALTGDEERRGGASSSAVFSRGYGVVSPTLGQLQFFFGKLTQEEDKARDRSDGLIAVSGGQGWTGPTVGPVRRRLASP